MLIKKNQPKTATPSERAKEYMKTWMMIQVDARQNDSLFSRKKIERNLSRYAKEFHLDDYSDLSAEQQEQRRLEWADFVRLYIQTCINSKTYRSTLFGALPLKDATVAQKIAEDILLITHDFPARYNRTETFLPLYEVCRTVYCQEVEEDSPFFPV
jgi:hypothetical protein